MLPCFGCSELWMYQHLQVTPCRVARCNASVKSAHDTSTLQEYLCMVRRTCVCRYSKNDGQLCKTLEQVMEGLQDYFVWADKHHPSVEIIELCLKRFLKFVDNMIMYFTGTGLPSKLSQSVMKIIKLSALANRIKVCESYQWQAYSMQGSANMWISAAPALRAALEGTGAESEQGRRKRARV